MSSQNNGKEVTANDKYSEDDNRTEGAENFEKVKLNGDPPADSSNGRCSVCNGSGDGILFRATTSGINGGTETTADGLPEGGSIVHTDKRRNREILDTQDASAEGL